MMRVLLIPYLRIWVVGAAILLAGATRIGAQAPGSAIFDPSVVQAVDRLAPGFVEILDCEDGSALTRLARTLQAQSQPEALTVLLWMLGHCPAWEGAGVIWRSPIAAALTRVPLGQFTMTLRNPDERQRQQGVILLAERLRRSNGPESDALEKALIAALDDPKEMVSEFAVNPLRERATPEAIAALERLASRSYIPGRIYRKIRGRPRPLPAVEVTENTFPTASLLRLEEVFPGGLEVLRTRETQAVRKLLTAIEQARDPVLTPVLIWLFRNADPELGGWFVYRLHRPPYVAVLPIPQLIDALEEDDPDVRQHIAMLFYEVLRGRQQVSAFDRESIVQRLTARLLDPSESVRRAAVGALSASRSAAAVPALISALESPDWSALEAVSVVAALRSIGSRDALPSLERLARTADLPILREAAATAAIELAKPTDPAAEIRHLLWKQPETALEKLVLKDGHQALPAVWRALQEGASDERRAASALLAWYPDVASIPHIIAALDNTPGARMRNQLLFDLSTILASGGRPPDDEEQRNLATAHLRWLFGLLAAEGVSLPRRYGEGKQREILIYLEVPPPFSVALSVTTTDLPGQRPQKISAEARLASREEFLAAMKKGGADTLVFQAIHEAYGVARVATMFVMGGFGYQTAVTLYRYDGAQWNPLPVPDYSGPVGRALSNLAPSFHHDYGPLSPLRAAWVNDVMSRVRIDIAERSLFRQTTVDIPGRATAPDPSYAPLFERFQQSDSASVRYAAAAEHARLTAKVDLKFWMEALENEQDERFVGLAVGAISLGVLGSIDREGQLLEGSSRDALVAAAIAPDPANSKLVPKGLPAAENVRQVRQAGAFALVEIVLGQFGSGYSMLFERRGERWVFLFATRGWIS